jgi:predicted transglutaminase-like cysteine proteinase
MMRGSFRGTLAGLTALLTALSLGAGCATPRRAASGGTRFFDRPAVDDPWTPQISSWQARERALPDVELLRPSASVSNPASAGDDRTARGESPRGDLRAEYFAFRAERKRELAREVARWIQSTSKRHYIPDGPVDHWATLSETLARNGDDCDGLELLTYHYLRDLGFREDEVYRAIVLRPSDKQHHMVTLWFEQRNDPWVIDPTGAMTQGMPHLSDVPGWVPLKVFSETEEFTVRGQSLERLIAERAR